MPHLLNHPLDLGRSLGHAQQVAWISAKMTTNHISGGSSDTEWPVLFFSLLAHHILRQACYYPPPSMDQAISGGEYQL